MITTKLLKWPKRVALRRTALRFSSEQKLDEYEAVPHYKQKSSLFINSKSSVFPRLVTPELNLSSLFDATHIRKSVLAINLSARHISLDLSKLQNDYFTMKNLQEKLFLLESEKSKISNEINQLVKIKISKSSREEINNSAEFRQLTAKGNELKSEINSILVNLLPLEEIVNISALRLPNDLHAASLLIYATQQNQDSNQFYKEIQKSNVFLPDENHKIVLFSLHDEKLVEIKEALNKIDWKLALVNSRDKFTHVEQSRIDLLINNKYLVGKYAEIEIDLVEYLHESLSCLNVFEHVKSVSMFKSVVVEGCGGDFNDTRSVFNVVRFGGGEAELLHLTGAASLNSLVLEFVRTKTKEKYLPWHLYTNGKSYSPIFGQTSKFEMLSLCGEGSEFLLEYSMNKKESINDEDIRSVLSDKGQVYLDKMKKQLANFQKNKTHGLKSLFKEAKTLDDLFIDYLKLFVFVYEDFKLPLRFSVLNAYELRNNEMMRVNVEAYLPSEHKHITVGEVSLLGEYVSKRLQIRVQKEEKNKFGHVSMIHATLMNINAFMQVLIESNRNASNQTNETPRFEMPRNLNNKFFS